MRHFLYSLAFLAAGASAALAQNPRACPHDESDRDRISRTLEAAATCQFAYDLMNACRSNTSGDVEFAAIVTKRCEGAFLPGLSVAGRKSYDDERASCRQRYAKREGTMYLSFTVTCEAGVAARHAAAAERRSRAK